MKPCNWNSKDKYDLLIGPLREKAREMGYALTVHGSLVRDIDLVACPWVEWAADPLDLSKALAGVVADVSMGYLEVPDPLHEAGCPGHKPHGRLVWKIQLGGGPYIDLSVMPRSEGAKPGRFDALIAAEDLLLERARQADELLAYVAHLRTVLFGFGQHSPVCPSEFDAMLCECPVGKALSLTPPAALELQRARHAVVEAAKRWASATEEAESNRIRLCLNLSQAVEALENLEASP